MMLVQHGLADRLHHIIGMNSGIDANDRRDANHWSDVNDRRNVDRRRDEYVPAIAGVEIMSNVAATIFFMAFFVPPR